MINNARKDYKVTVEIEVSLELYLSAEDSSEINKSSLNWNEVIRLVNRNYNQHDAAISYLGKKAILDIEPELHTGSFYVSLQEFNDGDYPV